MSCLKLPKRREESLLCYLRVTLLTMLPSSNNNNHLTSNSSSRLSAATKRYCMEQRQLSLWYNIGNENSNTNHDNWCSWSSGNLVFDITEAMRTATLTMTTDVHPHNYKHQLNAVVQSTKQIQPIKSRNWCNSENLSTTTITLQPKINSSSFPLNSSLPLNSSSSSSPGNSRVNSSSLVLRPSSSLNGLLSPRPPSSPWSKLLWRDSLATKTRLARLILCPRSRQQRFAPQQQQHVSAG